jgi:hypothetical protein
MSKIEILVPLLSVLRDLVAWLKAKRVQGLIIGGVAASILGRPRVTRDIDALVLLDEKNWDEFLVAGTRFGFVPRLTDPISFARKAKVLLVSPSGMVETPRLEAKRRLCEMVGRSLFTYSSRKWS